MLRGYILLLALVPRLRGFVLEDVHCNYIYRDNCLMRTAWEEHVTTVPVCNETEIPTEVNFVVFSKEDDSPHLAVMLRVDFALPRGNCKFGMSLLANSTIENQRDCDNYQFSKSDLDMETHTGEKTICSYDNETTPFINDGTANELCQDKVTLWFRHIFTGCYAIRFRLAEGEFLILGNKFLRTDYIRSEVEVPVVRCTYDVLSTGEPSKRTVLFATEISISGETGPVVKLGLSSDTNERKTCSCLARSQIYSSTIDLEDSLQNNLNCTINLEREEVRKSVRSVECNLPVETFEENANYCLTIRLLDERCKRQTLWRPPPNQHTPCTWIRRCTKVQRSEYREEASLTDSHLAVATLVIVLTMLTMFGVICLAHWLHTRAQYAWKDAGQQTSKLPTEEEKEAEDERTGRRDIVILYSKGSDSFMALMADFREILGRVCQCSVHDWHDGKVWNHVAKTGAANWFSELLENDCSVLWIDTPSTRSLLTFNFRGSANERSDLEKSRFLEIGDFRDVIFPAIFNMSKRNVQESNLRRSRHFIVRFKGFEVVREGDDPFTYLMPNAIYLMPQDFSLLSSQLSTMTRSVLSRNREVEENFIQDSLEK